MPGMPRLGTQATLLLLLAGQAAAQSTSGQRSSIVIAVGEQATVPIPTLMEGPAGTLGNLELADQLFLRLAGPGPTLLTSGDRGFVPLLARSWTRRDSVTLAFDLDPRARWQDGVPVTSRDVVFTFERAKNPASRASRQPRRRRRSRSSSRGCSPSRKRSDCSSPTPTAATSIRSRARPTSTTTRPGRRMAAGSRSLPSATARQTSIG